MRCSDDSESEDIDRVVKEIPICLAKTLLEKLFLFQYPVRPSSLTYDNTPHFAARMKPKQQKVELDLGLDINSPAYCFSRGEQIADAVDRPDNNKNSNQKPFFPGNIMDRHTLSSVRATENISKYVAATYVNGMLHLTPVKGIIQLRPGFSYFNKAEENQKKAAAAVQGDEDEASQDEMNDAQVVQLRFAKNPQKPSAKQAAQEQVKKEAEEHWIEMDFYKQNELRATQERLGLICQQNDFDSPEFSITSRDYLKILSPQCKSHVAARPELPDGKLSLVNLQQMELKDQLKNLMITTKIIYFSQLLSLLGLKSNEKEILQVLSKYAVLVQGCWVVKSEILYPTGSKTSISGMPAENIWPSRDYLMFLFNRKRFVSRKEAASTKLPTEELREVLETLARQKPGFGWELVLDMDREFLQKRFDVCNQQYLMWKERYKSLVNELNLPDPLSESLLRESDFPGLFCETQQKIQRRRRSSQSESGSESQRKRRTSQSESGSESNKERKSRRSSLSDSGSGKQKTKKTLNPSTNSQSKDNNENSKIKLEKALSESKKKQRPRISSNTESDSDVGHNINQATVRKKKNKLNKKPTSLETSVNNNGTILDSQSSDDDIALPKLKKTLKSYTSGENKKPKKTVRIEEPNNDKNDDNIEHSCLSDSDNPVNEVEVENTVTPMDDEIFIPPKIVASNKIIKPKEKPPSGLFLTELQKFCKNTIRSGSISLTEIKEVLAMRQQEAGNILCTGVTDELLIQCLKDTGAVEVNLKWDPDSNVPLEQRRIFVVKYTGEPHDKFRSIIIDMFEESFSLRRKDIIERFKTNLDESPSSHFYAKILTEFCEYHGGYWYLNGTYQSINKYDKTKDTS